MSRAFLLSFLPHLLSLKLATFKSGIGQFSSALADRVDVRYNSKAQLVRRDANQVFVEVHQTAGNATTTIAAKTVIMAIPASMVLSILGNPTEMERVFFSSVQYASTIMIHCRADNDPLRGNYAVWFPRKEEPYLASASINPHYPQSRKKVFVVALRDQFAKALLASGSLDPAFLEKKIRQGFDIIPGLEILHITSWEAAIPLFLPGHIRNIYKFKSRMKGERQIFYCGDYLGGPYIEGAVTSGMNVALHLLGRPHSTD